MFCHERVASLTSECWHAWGIKTISRQVPEC